MSRRRIIPAAHLSGWRDQLEEAARRAFVDQANAVRAVSRHVTGPGATLWDTGRWQATVARVVVPEVSSVVSSAITVARAQVPVQAALGVTSAASAGAPDRASFILTGLGNRFGGKLRRLNRIGAKRGVTASASDRYYYDKWGLDDLLDSGADELARAGGALADLVANSAAFDLTTSVAQDSSATRVWAAVGDDATREAHLDADGQEVGLDEPFDVGGEQLDYPGDPGGSDENVISCRCWLEINGSMVDS